MKDLTGQKIEKLTIIGLAEERNKNEKEREKNGEIKEAHIYWLCNCDCGTKNIEVAESNLTRFHTTSCGCVQKEKASQSNKKYNTYEFLEDGTVKGWDLKFKNFFLISKEDYEVVKQYCWYINDQGYFKTSRCIIDGRRVKNFKLHQLIMMQINKEYRPNLLTMPDHLNRLRYDNRRCNLELKTRKENQRNMSLPKNNTSGKKGVYYINKTKKWRAEIYNNEGKSISKTFKTKEEAINQRLEWENEFGYIGD